MRSLDVRRAAIAASLASADWLFIVLSRRDSRDALSRLAERLAPYEHWTLQNAAEHWIQLGAVVAPLLTVLAVIAFGARMLARQHVRAGGADPLERVRGWVARRRWVVRVFYAAAVLLSMDLWALLEAVDDLTALHLVRGGALLLGGVVLRTLAVVLPFRAFGRAVLAPLVDPSELERKDADGYLFSAVAVTAESRAAVVLFALLSVGFQALLAGTSLALTEAGVPVAIAYAAAVTLAAASFVLASRIAIGLDGVRVSGTSRTRFYAYRELDGVDVSRAGDILLLRRGRVALRLQLHGEDTARRGPIVERLQDAIARAHAPQGAGQRLAEAASPAVLAQAARGDGDYRSPAASRDALWDVVEAPAATGEARARAARALAAGADDADRARLRFAAEHCADPQARQVLARIAIAEREDDEAAEAPPRRTLQIEPR